MDCSIIVDRLCVFFINMHIIMYFLQLSKSRLYIYIHEFSNTNNQGSECCHQEFAICMDSCSIVDIFHRRCATACLALGSKGSQAEIISLDPPLCVIART